MHICTLSIFRVLRKYTWNENFRYTLEGCGLMDRPEYLILLVALDHTSANSLLSCFSGSLDDEYSCPGAAINFFSPTLLVILEPYHSEKPAWLHSKVKCAWADPCSCFAGQEDGGNRYLDIFRSLVADMLKDD